MHQCVQLISNSFSHSLLLGSFSLNLSELTICFQCSWSPGIEYGTEKLRLSCEQAI
jgi:hypothetical protein